jgi:hypothetical protein
LIVLREDIEKQIDQFKWIYELQQKTNAQILQPPLKNYSDRPQKEQKDQSHVNH